MSDVIVSVGAVCFGVVIGYVTYRTLARSGPGASVSDIAAVVGAVGGGAVTALFDPDKSDAFGYYSIGLLAGFGAYLVLSLVVRGRPATAEILGDDDPLPPSRTR